MSNLFKSIFQQICDKVVESLPALVDKVVEGLHSLVDKGAKLLKSGLDSLGDQVKIALKPEPPVAPEETLTLLEMNSTETPSDANAVTQALSSKPQLLNADLSHKLAAYTADKEAVPTQPDLAYLDLAYHLNQTNFNETPLLQVACAA